MRWRVIFMKNNINEILEVWNRLYSYDPISKNELKKRYFQNKRITRIEPNFYEGNYILMGYKTRFVENNDAENAYILSMGCNDDDKCKKLFENNISNLPPSFKYVFFSSFTPDYVLPGVDMDKYPFLYEILKKLNFREKETVISMGRELHNYEYHKNENIGNVNISEIKTNESVELLNFIRKNFSYDWYFRALGVLKYGTNSQIVVARIRGKIIGYGMFSSGSGDFPNGPGERFGPFGVEEQYRSQGIGTQILIRLLNNMKMEGIKYTYFLWTGEKAARLYYRFGFDVIRRFNIMIFNI